MSREYDNRCRVSAPVVEWLKKLHSYCVLVGVYLNTFGEFREISLSPLQTEEGTFVSGSIRDIIERRRAEAQTTHHFHELTKLLT